MRSAALVLALAAMAGSSAAQPYPWLTSPPAGTIESRVPPPNGFQRLSMTPGSFGAWLRGLPVKPGRPPVHLFDGRLKRDQTAHYLVLDVDVETHDLQQCADAVIRLRAEYLRWVNAPDEISFQFTNTVPARWSEWQKGMRPQVHGDRVTWVMTAGPDATYASFRRYLDVVFQYAGTYSLSRELQPVSDLQRVEAGDVFIQGGFPGHAVLVVDVAGDHNGRRAVLLAQSYVPAQEIHVLRNPASAASPWYILENGAALPTPEWVFPPGVLRRFRVYSPSPQSR